MIWKYGGLQFLLKIAKMMDRDREGFAEIIRSLVGIAKHGTGFFKSSALYLTQFTSIFALSAILPIGFDPDCGFVMALCPDNCLF
jgi:hypothetical protein